MSFIGLQKIYTEKKTNLQILFLLGICLAATYPGSSLLINEWLKWDQALSHGFACLILYAFFIWRQPFVSQQVVKPSAWTILLLGINSLCWCFSQLANLQLPSYVFMFAGYWFLLINIFNWQLAIKLLPLFGLFVFAIPVWSVFNDHLIQLSSSVVNWALQYPNLTLHIQDNHIMTPWGTIVIADGCSGLRYLVIALLMAYLLCLLNRYKLKTAVTVFVVATLLGLITNWIRILVIVLVGYYTELQHDLVRDHEFFGWILFASILFPALYFSPQYQTHLNPIIGKVRFSWVVTLAGLIGPFIYLSIPFNNNMNPIQLSTLDQQYEYSNTEPTLEIQHLPMTHVKKSSIILDKVTVHLTLITSAPTNKNEKIVPYINRLYDNFYWRPVQQIRLKNSNLEILENRSHQRKIILMHKFQVGSFITGDYYQAKFLQIPAKLLNQSYFGLWVAQANCQSDCTQELAAIEKLSEHW